jgi:hypothetical protein
VGGKPAADPHGSLLSYPAAERAVPAVGALVKDLDACTLVERPIGCQARLITLKSAIHIGLDLHLSAGDVPDTNLIYAPAKKVTL